ncbi:hypothetical protein EUX98_g5639 [Antrodiella citrinella]|uniref:RING-type domain-containing protein n=1 Tax=Antrodiella citrinella TaxID=2447956 RepID=A0A4S4MYR6_9APHY|nr:hypothetical protein EUX98_g5639 [Antrodiella citrinella]
MQPGFPSAAYVSAGTVQVENSAAGINVASLPEATPDIQATSINPAPSFVSLSIASISDEVIVKPDAASFDDLISLRDDQSDIDGDKASVVSEAITVILEPTLAHAEPGMRATPSDEVPISQANTDIQQALPRSTPIPTAEDLRQEANKSAGPPAPLMVMRCAWCKESPADPVLTMCGHMFCHGCLMPEVSKSLQCPSCKRPLFVRIDVPV